MRSFIFAAAIMSAATPGIAAPVVTDGPGFLFIYETTSIAVSSHDTTPAEATCPAGTLAISGGYDLNTPLLSILSSRPVNSNGRWHITIYNPTGSTISQDVVVFATCWGAH